MNKKDYKTIVGQYSKYLEAAEKGEGSELPSMFGKFYDFIYEQCGGDLYLALFLGSVGKALKLIKQKNVKLKSLSSCWSASHIGMFFETLDAFEKVVKYQGSSEQKKVLFGRLWKIIMEEQDVPLRLYMLLKHSETEDGSRFYFFSKYASLAKQLQTCPSNEAIADCLAAFNLDATPQNASDALGVGLETLKTIKVDNLSTKTAEEPLSAITYGNNESNLGKP